MTQAAEIGPVEYLIVGFPGNEFRGEIAPALADLVEAGTIRIIDIAFASKDQDGEVAAFELSDLDTDVREGLEDLGAVSAGLFNEDDLMAAATSSIRTRRRRCWCGRTYGPRRWRRQSGMRAASCTATTASRTRLWWRRASGRSPTPEGRS
jgi:hypothetical protein